MKPAPARLVKLATDDGLAEMNPAMAHIGKAYTVDLDSRRTRWLFNIEFYCHHSKEVIDARNEPEGTWGWLPTELLEIGDAQD